MIGAKVLATLVVAVGSMALALAIGALGNILGSAIAGVDTVWDVSVTDFLLIVLGNVLGMLVGFMLGIVIRNSPGAIVGYFVISFVLPALFMVLGNAQDMVRGRLAVGRLQLRPGRPVQRHMSGDGMGEPRGHRPHLARHPDGRRPPHGDAVRGQVVAHSYGPVAMAAGPYACLDLAAAVARLDGAVDVPPIEPLRAARDGLTRGTSE